MQLVILKDGTVPVAVAKVLATDGDLSDWRDEVANDDAHSYVEVFDVPDDSTAIGVSWADGMGFEVYGHRTLGNALAALTQSADSDVSKYAEGHWGTVYGEGDDESYGHVFTL